MDWSQVTALTIPEGNVAQIAVGDLVLWRKSLLPAGYTQLEYIKSNGTQWIDTGINGTAVTGFDIKAYAQGNGNSNAQVLGGTSDAATSFFGIRVVSGNSNWYAMDEAGNALVPASSTALTKATIVQGVNQTGTITNVDTGVTYNFAKLATTASSWGFPNANLLLFGGNTIRRTPLGRCYMLKLYTAEGLVRNFIPARRNSDNKVGMYDTVRKVFLTNQGTGEFIAGKEIYPLPTGYTQLDYIIGGQGAWLDTGIMPSDDLVFETKLDFDVSRINDNYFSSCRQDGGNTRYYLLNFNATYSFACSNSVWGAGMAYVHKTNVSAPYVIRSHIEETKVTLQVNDIESTHDATLAILPTASLPLFAGKTNIASGNPSITITPYPVKCYYARYIDNGEMIRNFIPCRRDSDGKVGMYDLITKEFKSSMTTTDFIAGTEV